MFSAAGGTNKCNTGAQLVTEGLLRLIYIDHSTKNYLPMEAPVKNRGRQGQAIDVGETSFTNCSLHHFVILSIMRRRVVSKIDIGLSKTSAGNPVFIGLVERNYIRIFLSPIYTEPTPAGSLNQIAISNGSEIYSRTATGVIATSD